MWIAGIEGGGTSWRAAICERSVICDGASAEIPSRIHAMESFPTRSPSETLGAIAEWLHAHESRHGPFAAMGIGTFGPVDCHEDSATYGFITNTPKLPWRDCDVLGFFRRRFPSVPMLFDTDVNAPAMAEFALNNPEGTSSCMYVTVGTGVGVGLVVNGLPVHGLVHPEGGHVVFPRMIAEYPGSCPFHGPCVEGLCNSRALAEIAGVEPHMLPMLRDDERCFAQFSHTMGQLCACAILLLSPERIVLSGGIMKRASLFPRVRAECEETLKGYVQHPKIVDEHCEGLIVPSPWGDDAGIIGSLYLGVLALARKEKRGWMASMRGKKRFYAIVFGASVALPVIGTAAVLALRHFLMRGGQSVKAYSHAYDPESRQEMIRRITMAGREYSG